MHRNWWIKVMLRTLFPPLLEIRKKKLDLKKKKISQTADSRSVSKKNYIPSFFFSFSFPFVISPLPNAQTIILKINTKPSTPLNTFALISPGNQKKKTRKKIFLQ